MVEDLSGLDLQAVQIDAIHLAEDLLLVTAVCIDGESTKHPLGLVEGATENAAVVQALLDGLVDRGLDPSMPRLFILDGARALSKAIRRTFGRNTPIQRCQVHKARDIVERLPKHLQPSPRRALRQARDLDDAEDAERLLRNLVRTLEREAPGVLASVSGQGRPSPRLRSTGLPPTSAGSGGAGCCPSGHPATIERHLEGLRKAGLDPVGARQAPVPGLGAAAPHLPGMLAHEATIRLGIFLGVLAVLLGLERWRPWGHARPLGARRWPHNLGLAVLGSLLVRAVVPAAAVGAAAWAEGRELGLFPALGVPGWLAGLLGIVLLDLMIYWQHRVTHAVPLLWRLHRVHHADPELDATSALRFHPVEILGSMALKMAAVVALGVPAAAVLAFEVILNATAMFNHAAIRLPPRIEPWVRAVLVTPEMHRTHHSEVPAETDSCYGFCLSWWDRLFGSYRAAPAAGEGVVIGVRGWRDAPQQRLDRLLVQPLRTEP